MSSYEQARTYLARVLPWAQEGDGPAYVNVVWSIRKGDDKIWSGRACTSLDDAISALKFAQKSKDTLDIYVGQATMREAQERVTKKGFAYKTPVRLQENAVALKSLWLDLDIKQGVNVNGYPTVGEAAAALNHLVKETGLPKPNVMVSTGGGLHVYWVMDRALSPQDWFPLATALQEAGDRHGLKFDHVSADAARILRIPDTFNRKEELARPVKLAKMTDGDYSVERIAAALEPYKTGATFNATSSAGATLAFELPNGVAPKAPLKGTSDLAAGIETAMPQVEVRACLDEIPNTKVDWNYWNTIGMRIYSATEGQDYGRDEWQLWSDKNPTAGATDSVDLRWQTFHGSPPTRTGAGALVNEVRAITGDPKWHPHIVAAGAAPGQAPASAANPAGAAGVQAQPIVLKAEHLPPDYIQNAAGVVSLVTTDAKTGIQIPIPVSDYPIFGGWLQSGPRRLHFNSIIERSSTHQISLDLRGIGGMDMRGALQEQGFMLTSKKQVAEDFIVSWIKRLQQMKGSVASVPFGWSDDPTTPGFVYGGQMFSPTGTTLAATADPTLAKQYSPKGGLDPWIEAAEMITNQRRPGLDALLASAFAGPLVKMSGQRGLMLSTWSSETGIGKTTALAIAQAVWASPLRTQGLTDTMNFVFGKMSQLKNLPIFWDEIKTSEDYKAFVKLVFQLTRGSEKGRMKANTALHEGGEWQTLLTVASNDSLLDYVVQQTSTSQAGLVRVFEFAIEPGTIGQINRTDADRMVGRLNDNFGHPGLAYAEFLGQNEQRVYDEYGDLSRDLGAECNERTDERFWMILMSCLLLGARYANELQLTDIDEPALKAFLIEKLDGMRNHRATTTNDLNKAVNVANILGSFLTAMSGRHTIWTDRVHTRAGKPAPGSIKVVRTSQNLDGIYVQIGEDKICRINRQHLFEWLKEKDISRGTFAEKLLKEFGGKVVNGFMASGTSQRADATSYMYEITLAGSGII